MKHDTKGYLCLFLMLNVNITMTGLVLPSFVDCHFNNKQNYLSAVHKRRSVASGFSPVSPVTTVGEFPPARGGSGMVTTCTTFRDILEAVDVLIAGGASGLASRVQ